MSTNVNKQSEMDMLKMIGITEDQVKEAQQKEPESTEPEQGEGAEVELSKEDLLKGWNIKHPLCTSCHSKERKRYSGAECTRCYTKRRNERLGLKEYSTEWKESKVEKITLRILKLAEEMEQLQGELEKLEQE